MQRILQKAKCVAVAALAVSTAALLPLPGDGSWGEALAFETVGNDFGGDTDRESDGFGRSDYGEGGAEGGRTHLDRLVPMPDEWRESGGAPEVVPAQTQRTVRRTPRRRAPPRRTAPPQPAQPAQPALPPIPSERENELVAAGLDDAVIDTLTGQGFSVIERTPVGLLDGDVVRLSVPDGTDLATAQATVQAAAPEAIVDFNTIYTPTQGACDGLACQQLALVSWPVEARGASTPEACGSGITIGVIDTGINPDHEALRTADVTLLSLLGGEPVVSRRTHGTAVAAVLVGSGDPRIQGLLPDARLVAIDAFEVDPHGRSFSDAFRLVAALDALSEEEPDVMNLSLSGPPNELLGRAVGVVTERGSLIVAAVGNAGPSSPPLYPAAYPEVIAATAIDADFRIYRRAVRGEHVEFSAPGVRVWTAASLRGARPKTGTSYAAPFVTAAVALAVKSGALDRESAVERLTASVEDLGPVGRDNIYGFGLVKAADLCAPTPGEATVTTVATEADEGADAEAFSLAGE